MSQIHTDLRKKGLDRRMFVLQGDLQTLHVLKLLDIKKGKVTGVTYYRLYGGNTKVK